jgi:hypothetical protein
MYFDTRPCDVCGAAVRLEPRDGSTTDTDVDPDATIDQRVCTSADCPTHRGEGAA